MTDYRDTTLADHPDLHKPPATIRMRCGRGQCLFEGEMSLTQTEPGSRRGIEGSAEPPTWEARCPKCHKTRELYGDELECDGCPYFDQPDVFMDIDGKRLCVRCRHEQWNRGIDRLVTKLQTKMERLEAAS